ncbi:hypothetical protein CQ020_23170 [Arthrobacter sp. MYb23]|uniref:hypothetical protein n=1 Tax=unclassified Arthrobacter TaxID=235627 RepID=UPI000CFDF91B|nr:MULTISPECIES: hypothetical protein [unclassified Arthrobacter]PRB42020.1 hypothetical protein CQ038_10985 [Arthrobacter sp. MYb51]PRB89050.1 hypothetical protein CQ020_23170 [Arthrobacter sp. MYb23]
MKALRLLKAERLLRNLLLRLGFQPRRRATAPDDGGSSAAVVDVWRGTVSLQLTVGSQPL